MFKIHHRAKTNVLQGGGARNSGRTKLIAGLGNPGSKYQNTFHNVGFMLIDNLVEKRGGEMEKYRDFEFLRMENRVIVKPLGFMNRSGAPTKRALKYFGLEAKDLVVIHDDSDLRFGQYKVSFGRGSAGHKGVESVVQSLKTNQFTRIRVGIRKDYDGETAVRHKAEEFVLKKMSEQDLDELKKLFLEIGALELKA